ncbi:MAG: hypothetical protein Q9M26_00145 [Mariprofundales bacterium]|nr:hypothetical protein [Mariprofundales bacterium]
MPATVQQSMERFIHHRYHTDRETGHMADACMNLLSDYLQFWSGLFQQDGLEMAEELSSDTADWERELDAKMAQWMDDDTAPVNDLGSLTIDQMDEEHLREFIGWYLLKDMALDSHQVRELLDTLGGWISFSRRNHALEPKQADAFSSILEQTLPETVRAATAANALQQMVQSGQFRAPPATDRCTLRGFVAGMARLRPAQGSYLLTFDDNEIASIPITLPQVLHPLLREGDVLHIYLASYGDQRYRLVDSGPLFPASTWVEATLMERFAPMDTIEALEWDQNPGSPLN